MEGKQQASAEVASGQSNMRAVAAAALLHRGALAYKLPIENYSYYYLLVVQRRLERQRLGPPVAT